MAITLNIVGGRPLVQLEDHHGDIHDYTVEPLASEPGRLLFGVARHPSEDGEHSYVVEITGSRYTCSCPSFRYRRRAERDDCKHVRAIRELRRLLAALAS